MNSTSDTRIPAVDILRGVAMAAMIVVNNPGSWTHMYGWLRHAEWNYAPGFADFVFPAFLYLVGVATVLSIRPRRLEGLPLDRLLRRVFRRCVLLIAIGILLNLFPQFDLATARLPGVLQRIAVVAFGCAIAELWMSTRVLFWASFVLLVGYNAALLALPIPGLGVVPLSPEMNWPVWLDERVFGVHRWPGAGDPEGILSSCGALVTGWIGVLSARALVCSRSANWRILLLATMAALLFVLGLFVASSLPISKELWTASYCLITVAVPMFGLALLDRIPRQALQGAIFAPWRLFGRQALLAYIFAHLISDASIYLIRLPMADRSISLHSWFYQFLGSNLAADSASLVFALCMLGVVFALVWILDREGVRLRV